MEENFNKTHNPFFWVHIRKAGGTSIKKALKEVYVTSPRPCPQPFVSILKEQWNDDLNNDRLPLRTYDFKRTLFAKRYLYPPSDWDMMFKFVVVRNPYDRAVSA